jgi:hypothetical protein
MDQGGDADLAGATAGIQQLDWAQVCAIRLARHGLTAGAEAGPRPSGATSRSRPLGPGEFLGCAPRLTLAPVHTRSHL